MKTFASLALAAFGVVATASVANTQALVAQPYQTVVVPPGATVIRQTPLFAVPAGQPIEVVSAVERVRTIHPAARTVAHHHLARKYQDRLAADDQGPLYNTAAPPAVQGAVAAPVVQTV